MGVFEDISKQIGLVQNTVNPTSNKSSWIFVAIAIFVIIFLVGKVK